jgi:hypothetical protein
VPTWRPAFADALGTDDAPLGEALVAASDALVGVLHALPRDRLAVPELSLSCSARY